MQREKKQMILISPQYSDRRMPVFLGFSKMNHLKRKQSHFMKFYFKFCSIIWGKIPKPFFLFFRMEKDLFEMVLRKVKNKRVPSVFVKKQKKKQTNSYISKWNT